MEARGQFEQIHRYGFVDHDNLLPHNRSTHLRNCRSLPQGYQQKLADMYRGKRMRRTPTTHLPGYEDEPDRPVPSPPISPRGNLTRNPLLLSAHLQESLLIRRPASPFARPFHSFLGDARQLYRPWNHATTPPCYRAHYHHHPVTRTGVPHGPAGVGRAVAAVSMWETEDIARNTQK